MSEGRTLHCLWGRRLSEEAEWREELLAIFSSRERIWDAIGAWQERDNKSAWGSFDELEAREVELNGMPEDWPRVAHERPK